MDDEPDILDLAMTILETHGYQVIGAPDGESAIQKVEVETPDLILMDVVMPGRSGIETCRVLKSKPRTKYVPVVLFSVLRREVDVRMARECGAEHLLAKPFTEEDLTKEVKKYLQEARWEKFSKQLSTDHKGLLGKKILLEYEPSSHHEQVVRDFTNECASHSERVIVLTEIGKPLYNALKGDVDIECVTLGMPTPMLTELLKEQQKPAGLAFDSISDLEHVAPGMPSPMPTGLLKEQQEPVGLVFDSITDLVVARGTQVAHQYLRNALGFLENRLTNAIFLLNPSAHAEADVNSLRGLFSSRAVFGSEGLVAIRLA